MVSMILMKNIFESSATHAYTPKGTTAEQWIKVWQVSNKVAQQTLDMTTNLNKQDTDSTLSLVIPVQMIACCSTRYFTPYFSLIHSTSKKLSVNEDFQ